MSKDKKKVSQAENPDPKKVPKTQVNLSDDQTVVFYFATFDRDGPFPPPAQCGTMIADFADKLKNFQRMRWSEVENHAHCGSKDFGIIEPEARSRLEELQLAEERVYQLNFGGKKRLWGLKQNNLFMCLWWDPDHKIYPTAPAGRDREKFNKRKGRNRR